MEKAFTENWENHFLSIGFLPRVTEDRTRIDKVTDFCRFLSPLRLRKFTFKLGPILKDSWLFQKNGSKEMEYESKMVSWWKEQWTRNSEWSKYTFVCHETVWCPERTLGLESKGKTWVLAFLFTNVKFGANPLALSVSSSKSIKCRFCKM